MRTEEGREGTVGGRKGSTPSAGCLRNPGDDLQTFVISKSDALGCMAAGYEREIDAICRPISSASIALFMSGRYSWLCCLSGIYHTRSEYMHLQSAETPKPHLRIFFKTKVKTYIAVPTVQILRLDFEALCLHPSRPRGLIHSRQSSYLATNTSLPSSSSSI